MAMRSWYIVAVAWLSMAAPALAQFKDGEPDGPKIGEAKVSRWKIGITITASGGACTGGNGYMAVPKEWPEQEVSVVKEDISPEIKIHYTTIAGGVKIMNLKIGQLAAGQEAHAAVTFETRRSVILPPENTDIYVLSDPRETAARNACLPDAEPADRKPRPKDPRVGQDDRRRQGERLG